MSASPNSKPCLRTWIISLATFVIMLFESNFNPPNLHRYWWLCQMTYRYTSTHTHVPVDFTNSTSLIQTVWFSKHHKSPHDYQPNPSHLFSPSYFLSTLSSLHLSLYVIYSVFNHSLISLSSPRFFGRSRKFVVCSLNSALMDWLSSTGLKISPRANPLLFPGCHAEDE